MIRRFLVQVALPALLAPASLVPALASAQGGLPQSSRTEPVVLRGHLNGMTGVRGKRRAGFEAETTINRKDFNMNWNRIVEGSSMVGDEVRIEIDIAAVEQPR